jgi:hypothetical protein
LRPTTEIEARAAVLHVVVARCFGMPTELAMSWLLGSHLVERVTPPEWQFVIGAKGDHRSFVLHHDAVFALAWLLGLSRHLDPTAPPEERLMRQMPDLPGGETFDSWRSRSLVAPRDALEDAAAGGGRRQRDRAAALGAGMGGDLPRALSRPPARVGRSRPLDLAIERRSRAFLPRFVRGCAPQLPR